MLAALYVYTCMYWGGDCLLYACISSNRLPKNQECHEMWSRKKRKKEAAAAAAAAGGVVKEGAGSSNGSGPPPGKPMLSDLSRSRSQSGSPVKEPQQHGTGVGPRAGGTEVSSISLANGSLPPKVQAPPPPAPPPPAPLASQPHNMVPGVAASLVPQATLNLKQYPLNQTHPVIPSHLGGGTALPPQLHPHAPIINPQLQLIGEAVVQGSGIASSAVVVGDGGIQVKQAHKTLANPSTKPSLTVPLPTIPLSASILDSLHDNVSGTATTSSGSLANTGGGGGTSLIVSGAGGVPAEQPQLKDASHSTGTSTVGGVGGAIGSSSTATQQIQQVIDAQRTHIALLSQITQLVTDQKRQTNPQQDPGVSSSGGSGLMRGHVSTVPPGPGGYPQRNNSSIVSRAQTYDYGNRSNKVLESAAVQQLEQEYYHGNPNSRKWS